MASYNFSRDADSQRIGGSLSVMEGLGNLDPSVNGLIALLQFLSGTLGSEMSTVLSPMVVLSTSSFIWNLENVFHRNNVTGVTVSQVTSKGQGNPHVDSPEPAQHVGKIRWTDFSPGLPCACSRETAAPCPWRGDNPG